MGTMAQQCYCAIGQCENPASFALMDNGSSALTAAGQVLFVVMDYLVCVSEGLNASINYNVSEGHLIATCSAVGYPEPTISWNNVFNYTPTQEKFTYDNGVVSITSVLKVYDSQNISKEDLTCRVSNESEEMELPISMKKSRWLR